ncbi:MAG: Arc family DNA-binding protein [Desulfobacterales bacterium]|nr:Arc family DNA-binding protein [Desulfobacterales bacterium]
MKKTSSKKESEHLQIWFPQGLKKALKIAAERNDRSMAGLIRKLVKDHLQKEGIPWEGDEG